MNVEATNHSPSVTVSIFDALAEILTSTPKPRISTTTEVTKPPILNTDVTKILDSVSNVNVNSAQGISTQDNRTAIAVNVSTITKSVQNTDQATPNVINTMTEISVTQSPNTQDENITPVNTLPTPTLPPSTPVSARRPFAIKVLYSDTERPTDKTTTTTQATSIQPTDPTMVYNTVSDLLLANNSIVSSELTSMLSNNIKEIIQNMDEDSRSRISGDMASLLKNLIPRALNGLANSLENADFVPNTTPYSLQDLRDTENIDINIDSVNIDFPQNVAIGSNVNITVDSSNTPVKNDVDIPTQTVNNTNVTRSVTENTQIVSSSETTSAVVVTPMNEPPVSLATEATTSITVPLTSSVTLDNRTESEEKIPAPFLTNYRIDDLPARDLEKDNLDENSNNWNTLQNRNAFPLISSPTPNIDEINIQDPSQISRFQLWVLSKKARVLKMIEDLIRQHNDELASPPLLSDIASVSQNMNLSERLTDIMNNMTSTTSTVTNTDITNSPLAAPSFPPFTFSPTLSVRSLPLEAETTTTQDLKESTVLAATTTLASTNSVDVPETTTISKFDSLSFRFGSDDESIDASTTVTNVPVTTFTDNIDTFSSTTATATTEQTETMSSTPETSDTTITNTGNSEITTEQNTETAAFVPATETTTQFNLEITTQILEETTTEAAVETTTAEQSAVTTILSTTPSNKANFATTIPKKDFVIFGILPNNTVVRKDPNDNVLESLTEASPYIVYGVLPNNTIIRKFPNGTRVPRVMQKIDVLPISPWSLRNPYSPIHNNPAIVRPRSNPIRVSTNIDNTVTSTDTSNNGTEYSLTIDTVNNQQNMVPTLHCLA